MTEAALPATSVAGEYGGDETATSFTAGPSDHASQSVMATVPSQVPPHQYSPMSTMNMPPSTMPVYYESTRPAPPTLRDVLSRRSNPPVCLYNYYLYLRDREQTQHYLDFWLDVTAHENRCRIYCKNLIRASKRLTATSSLTAQHHNNNNHASTSGNNNNSLNVHQLPPHSTTPDKPNRASWGRLSIRDVSNELRYSTISQQTGVGTLDHPKTSEQMVELSHHIGEEEAGNLQAHPVDQSPDSHGNHDSQRHKKPVSREDIQRSARKIYKRYMVPGARRELHFPESIRYPIVQAIEERTEHNLSEKQATFRLVAGLMILFIGFTVEFSLIFLNRRRTLRLYGIIPILFAIINLFSYLVRFCPFFTLFGTTETSYRRFAQIKDRYIRRSHRIRAMKIVGGALLLTLVVVGIFMAPPGHRL
ncbi:hypothetical protein BDF22DRAFT_741131 [Syncephalis plumigaleata]|nr:hypothetical protein BDF22DRAFT_741131 [Syncephalis plumigaleata]